MLRTLRSLPGRVGPLCEIGQLFHPAFVVSPALPNHVGPTKQQKTTYRAFRGKTQLCFGAPGNHARGWGRYYFQCYTGFLAERS